MPLEEKRNVVANLRSMEGSEEPPPKVCRREADLDNRPLPPLSPKTLKIFPDLLDIDKGSSMSILSMWGTNPMYQAGARRVRGLLVTNDAAERRWHEGRRRATYPRRSGIFWRLDAWRWRAAAGGGDVYLGECHLGGSISNLVAPDVAMGRHPLQGDLPAH
ncbi:hypothetical protein GWK47_049313 [Chionoecetes opilio]|uniref:Uncharacterized protein n=1 Tax=Chionoecetes opilio TaxID=41210 RepID=A0A8J5CF77_CHIOP|nr:hypothetical protein GWK47_049313 [Chionoecetes opilio]